MGFLSKPLGDTRQYKDTDKNIPGRNRLCGIFRNESMGREDLIIPEGIIKGLFTP